jgi:hypothetical protein
MHIACISNYIFSEQWLTFSENNWFICKNVKVYLWKFLTRENSEKFLIIFYTRAFFGKIFSKSLNLYKRASLLVATLNTALKLSRVSFPSEIVKNYNCVSLSHFSNFFLFLFCFDIQLKAKWQARGSFSLTFQSFDYFVCTHTIFLCI